MFQSGVSSLTNAELVAIVLRHGAKGKNATTLARELLAHFGSLRALLSEEPKKLRQFKGMGPAKIAALMAAAEMAKRQMKEEILGRNVLRDPESVMTYLGLSLRDRKKEVFKVIFLNKANCILGEKDLFEGTVDEAAVHPREVVKAALDHHATGLILAHNHPSGRIQPSREDLEITKKLQAACATVSVKILDHIIVGDNQYFSFSEHHQL